MRCRSVIFLVFLLFLSIDCPVRAGKTVSKSGTWLAISSPGLVQAEFDGKVETVCLPKLEFLENVNGEELLKQMRSGLKKQPAVFHLFKDSLGFPIKKGFMLFASDVYLKDLKVSYSSAMRSWGYKFKISPSPAFEDPAYMLQVQSGSGGSGSSSFSKANLEKSPSVTTSSPVALMRGISVQAFRKSAFHVLPPGVLPPPVRKEKKVVAKKVAEVKGRPFKSEKFVVDVVRWASGKMGEIDDRGRITKAFSEGKKMDFILPLPSEKNWLTDDRKRMLASQPCEFVIHRDIHGREAKKDGKYLLADLYLSDLAMSWEEWLEQEKLSLASVTLGVDIATKPITLEVVEIDALWRGLRAPALARATIPKSDMGSGKEEVFRLRQPETRLKKFRTFAAGLNKTYIDSNIKLFLVVCDDGKPYMEFGQKRIFRVFFRKTKKTFQELLENAKAEEK